MRVQLIVPVVPALVIVTQARVVMKDCSVFNVKGVNRRRYLAVQLVELGIFREQITAMMQMDQILQPRHLL